MRLNSVLAGGIFSVGNLRQVEWIDIVMVVHCLPRSTRPKNSFFGNCEEKGFGYSAKMLVFLLRLG